MINQNKTIRPPANSTGRLIYYIHCHKPKVLKLTARLRLGLNHLRFHKFKYLFQNTLNFFCNSGTAETTGHVLLHCPNFSNERLALLNKPESIAENNSNIF